MRERGLMCVRMVSSAALFSSGIRMCLYILMRRNRNLEETVERLERGFGQEGVQKQFHVEQNNNPSCRPAQNFQPKPISKLAHFRAFPGKAQRGYLPCRRQAAQSQRGYLPCRRQAADSAAY